MGIVNVISLIHMLSKPMTDKTTAVHALVRWNTKQGYEGMFCLYDQNHSFDMVSRFTQNTLGRKTCGVKDLSGAAKGHTGALFEVLAARRFLARGIRVRRVLSEKECVRSSVGQARRGGVQPTVSRHNTIGRDVENKGGWENGGTHAYLWWPTTINIPTLRPTTINIPTLSAPFSCT